MEEKLPNNLSMEEITFLYQFLCEYETSLKSQKTGWRITDNDVKKFFKENNIKFEYNPVSKNYSVSDKNVITFKGSQNTIFDFFRHLRNAIAHAKLRREADYYYFEDNNNGKLSASGIIAADLLQPLLSVLKSSKKQKK